MSLMVFHTLEPVFDASSKVLILGSFPSVISRKKNFYYANPQNRFWKVMSLVFQGEITDRKSFCLQRHIALWDVIGSCEIKGSSDATITNVHVNDIEWLLNQSNIHVIYTTGTKAYQLFRKHIHVSVPVIPLPSTSGANARMSLKDLVLQYQIIAQEVQSQ